MESNQTLIRLDSVSAIREGVPIIDNISLSLQHHDFVTIVGPNGAGKTTLLRILAGLEKISTGKIVKKNNIKIAFLPQISRVSKNIPMRVIDFLKLNQKKGEGDFEEEYEQMKKMCLIEEILHKQMSVLSGGELQRVLIARTLSRRPNIMLLDEPTAHLDYKNKSLIYKIINTLFRNHPNISMVIVSHDINWVMAESKKVVCFFHHICCSGTPKHVSKQPDFVKFFGKEYLEQVAVYHHSHGIEHEH